MQTKHSCKEFRLVHLMIKPLLYSTFIFRELFVQPISSIMRAVRVQDGRGDPDATLHIGQAPDPTLGPGKVLIEVKAFGLNRLDNM